MQLRLAFSCALGLPLSSVLFNSTFDVGTGQYAYYPPTDPTNAVAPFAVCEGAARRLTALLIEAGAGGGAAEEGRSLSVPDYGPPPTGVELELLLLVAPRPSPSTGASPTSSPAVGGPAGGPPADQLATADDLMVALVLLAADFSSNSTNATNPLTAALAGFTQALATALGVPAASVLSLLSLSISQPVLILPTPSPTPGAVAAGASVPAGGLSTTDKNIIIGVIVGVGGAVIVLVAAIMLVRRRAAAKQSPGAAAGATVTMHSSEV